MFNSISHHKSVDKFIHKSSLANFHFDEYYVYKIRKFTNESYCSEENCVNLIIECFKKGMEILRSKLGDNEEFWKWGNFNIKHFSHLPMSKVPVLKLLFHRSIKTDGSRRTPKIATYFIQKDFTVNVNSNYKTIMNGLKPDGTYFSLDTGISGKVFHNNYDNLKSTHEKDMLIRFSSNIQKTNPKEMLNIYKSTKDKKTKED